MEVLDSSRPGATARLRREIVGHNSCVCASIQPSGLCDQSENSKAHAEHNMVLVLTTGRWQIDHPMKLALFCFLKKDYWTRRVCPQRGIGMDGMTKQPSK